VQVPAPAMLGYMVGRFSSPMNDKAIEPGQKSTERYLPREAWARLSPEERKRTDEKKQRASRTGRQFVPNTERASKARRAVELASRRKTNG
jgi:hypothetical protein